MKLNTIEESLAAQGISVFSSQEFRRALALTPASAKLLLIRYVKKGYILRLRERRGLYCLKKNRPHPWQLANKLRRPSYVSLETALSYYGLIPESIYAITSVTPKTSKSYDTMDLHFSYQKIKASAFTGYQPLKIDGQTIWIAEPEKAMADYLYFVHLGRKTLNDRFRWTALRRRKIFTFMEMFERKGLMDWGHRVIPG